MSNVNITFQENVLLLSSCRRFIAPKWGHNFLSLEEWNSSFIWKMSFKVRNVKYNSLEYEYDAAGTN